jgi:hypothetical protein
MKKNLFFIAAVTAAVFAFSSCSNLFEQFADDDGTVKTGDDSLSVVAGNTDIDNGLVVIKNTATTDNQIRYTTDSTGSIQKNYFVGTLPMSSADYSAAVGSTIVPDYTNGSTTCLTGKDNPVVLKCIPNDTHAKITWSAKQIYKYTPQTAVYTTADADGNTVTYTGIKSVDGATIASADQPSVSFTLQNNEGTIIESDLPYGVTVVTAVVTADDGEYSTTYTITLTKKYTLTIAGQEDSNNVTTSGLVVIKQTMPSTNQIQFDPLTYSYTIGDPDKVTVKATDDTTGNLTGKDDPVSLKCYIPDSDATITWTAKQTKTFTPNYTTYNTTDSSGNAVTYQGISSETLTALTTPVPFDVISAATSAGTNPYLLVDQATTQKNQIVTSDLPYGVTVVTCTVTGYDDDGSGTVKAYTSVYTVTLVKQYIITTATAGTASELDSGLVVIKNSVPMVNQISYVSTTLDYTVAGYLYGYDDAVIFKCIPEDKYHTTVVWSAVQTQSVSYDATETSVNSGVYTLISHQTFTDISPTVVTFTNVDTSTNFIQSATLPYGTTKVTVTVSSDYDINKTATVYTITLKKLHVSTKVNITTDDGKTVSTDTTHGLVVVKATAENINQIAFDSNITAYAVTDLICRDDPVILKCFLTDGSESTDTNDTKTATVTWKATQTYSYDSSDKATACNTDVSSLLTPDISDSTGSVYNEVQNINLPYGVTKVTATISNNTVDESDTTYTITLTKKHTVKNSDQTATMNNLSITAKNTTDSDTPVVKMTPATFTPTTTTYKIVVDESTDDLTFTFNTSETVDIDTVTYVHKDGTKETVASPYTILLDGGVSQLQVTTKDTDGNYRTYYLYVTKPKDNDTSLEKLTYTTTATQSETYGAAITPSILTPSSSDMSKDYTLTASADNRYDLQTVTFTAIQTHKYATLAYAVADTCPEENDSSWTTPSSKSVQNSSSPITMKVSFEKEDQTKKTSVSQTLWIKVIPKVTNDNSKIQYHSVTITKPGNADCNLTSGIIVVQYQNDNITDLKELDNIPDANTVGNKIATGTTAYTVTTYADAFTFYVRTLDKDAEVTYKAIAVDSFDTLNENVDEETFTGRHQSVSGADITDKTYPGSLYMYKSFTIGKKNTTAGATDDLPDGCTQVVIYVNNSPKYTYNITKPDSKTASLSGLGTVSRGSGGESEPYEMYYYVKTSSTTNHKFELQTGYEGATLTLIDCKQTIDASDNTVDNTVSYYLSKASTTESSVGPQYELVVGDMTEYTATQTGTVTTLPGGTTTVNFKVTNNSSNAYYRLYIIKSSDTENRLSTLTENEQTVSGFTWNSASDINTYTNTSHETGKIAIVMEPVSSESTIASTAKYSQKEITAFDDDSWSSATTIDDSNSGNKNKPTYIAATAGWYLITITVTSPSNTKRIYKIIQPVTVATNATLSGLATRQYKTGTSGDYYTVLGTEFKSTTESYTVKTSFEYAGNIVLDATTTSDYATVKITSVTCDGVENDAVGTQTASSDNSITLDIPYASYKTLLGKDIVVTYTVTAQDGSTSKTYIETVKLSSLESVSVTENNVSSANKQYYYNADYTHIMAYRLGSERTGDNRGSSYYTSTNGYGGIDIIASKDKGTTWGACSYALSGFIYIVNVGGVDYPVKLIAVDTPVTVTEGVTLMVSSSLQYNSVDAKKDAVPYVTVKHTITNTTGKTVKLGVMIDTLVNSVSAATASSADSVTIVPSATGFSITNAGYSFEVYLKDSYNVNTVDTFWYGEYGYDDICMFNPENYELDATPTDSAVSFSWNCGTETNSIKTFRMSLK